MLTEILRYREDALHGQEGQGGRAMDRRFRDGFRELRRRHDEIVAAFVYWKRTGPEGAVHELLLAARGLENPDARPEDDRDLARLAENLARRGFYRSMTSPLGEATMDEVIERMFREQVGILRRLVERAAEGLRPVLERRTFDGIVAGTLANYGRRNLVRGLREDGGRDEQREHKQPSR